MAPEYKNLLFAKTGFVADVAFISPASHHRAGRGIFGADSNRAAELARQIEIDGIGARPNGSLHDPGPGTGEGISAFIAKRPTKFSRD
ncbi:MAG: hypothetical protein ACREQR_08515 [Candidatus Binataceae bacterium]